MRRYIGTVKQPIGFGFSVLLLAAMFAFFSFAQNKPTPKAAASQTPQSYAITVVHVQPSMSTEFQDLMKNEVIPANRKAGVDRLYIFRTAIFGEAGIVLIIRPIKDLAEFDSPSPTSKRLANKRQQNWGLGCRG